MNRKEGYGFVVAVHSPENTGDPPTKYVRGGSKRIVATVKSKVSNEKSDPDMDWEGRMERLVKKGGRFEGYTSVIQGDNAGPHNDVGYSRYVTDYCKKVGWLWEPQGP
eukprot:scaffold10559_cov267-Chaetoceros_neogracile.AAC.18